MPRYSDQPAARQAPTTCAKMGCTTGGGCTYTQNMVFTRNSHHHSHHHHPPSPIPVDLYAELPTKPLDSSILQKSVLVGILNPDLLWTVKCRYLVVCKAVLAQQRPLNIIVVCGGHVPPRFGNQSRACVVLALWWMLPHVANSMCTQVQMRKGRNEGGRSHLKTLPMPSLTMHQGAAEAINESASMNPQFVIKLQDWKPGINPGWL